jgi:hypothetical protein
VTAPQGCFRSVRYWREWQGLAACPQRGYNCGQMRRALLALAIVAIVYVGLAFLVLPEASFFSSDEGLKLIQVQNFVRKGWSGFTLDYPGRWLDPDLKYVPINNPPPLIQRGDIFAVYPVFFPLLATPFFELLNNAGLYVIPVVSGILTLFVTYWLARLLRVSSTSSLLILGLCTPLLFYSLLFWDHTLGTLLATTALLLATRSLRHPSRWSLLGGGLVLGLSIWARTELYAMALVLPVAYFLFGGRRTRQTILLCLGVVAALVPLWLFQFATYGNPIGPHVMHFASLGEELPVTTNRLAILYYTLLEANSNPLLTFLFAMSFVAATILLWSPRLRQNRTLVGIVFGALVLTSLPNLLQAWSGRPLGGLIATTPFLVFSLGVRPDRQGGESHRLLLGTCVGYIALVCLATPVDPGLQWGPRFLLPIFPPAAVLALSSRRALTQPPTRSSSGTLLAGCLAATLGISLLFQACGIRVMYVVRNRDRQLMESTANLDSRWIISDEYGLAQYLAPLFYQKEFFYVRSQEEYQELTESFIANGIHKYAVVSYPAPQRRLVDPAVAPEGYTVRQVGQQIFEIEQTGSPR